MASRSEAKRPVLISRFEQWAQDPVGTEERWLRACLRERHEYPINSIGREYYRTRARVSVLNLRTLRKQLKNAS